MSKFVHEESDGPLVITKGAKSVGDAVATRVTKGNVQDAIVKRAKPGK